MTLVLTITFLSVATFAAEAATARIPARQQAWQFRWEVWLADKWQRLGACETGYGKRPGNWLHDARDKRGNRYVSAFGILYENYQADARFAGAPRWERRPTPWQQFRTALAHYRLHGGFSGWGCRGA